MRTGIFVGRFQPLHEGHKQCIERVLAENDRCIVFIRDTQASDKNPFTYEERVTMIKDAFPDGDRVSCAHLPDDGADLTVYIGRDVGYELIQFDAATESISATDIRKELYQEEKGS